MRAETTSGAIVPFGQGQTAQQRMAGATPGARRAYSRLRWLIAAVLGWALLYVFLYVPARGNGSDFQDFYAAAYADAHGIDLYNWPALWRAEQIVYNGGVGHTRPFSFVPYGNPPPFALLLRPLTALPESAAYLLWACLILLTTAGGAYLGLASWPRRRRILATILIALSPAALFNVRLGQSSSLLVLGLGAAVWLLHRRRGAAAGAALTLGMVKPHLAIPLACIALCAAPREQRRSALLGFLAATAAWGALAVVADGGPGIFGRWWASIHDYLGSIRFQPDVASIPGIYYANAPEAMIGPLNSLCLLLAAAAIIVLARRAWGGEARARALLFGGGIAAYFALSPYVHTGDQVVLALPLLALIGPDAQGLRQNAVLLAATAAILAPMVVFRNYHTELINALPPLCLGLAYAQWGRQPAVPAYATPKAASPGATSITRQPQ